MRQYVGFMNRYIAPPAAQAVKEYQDLADSFSLPLGPLALAFVYSRFVVFVTLLPTSNMA